MNVLILILKQPRTTLANVTEMEYTNIIANEGWRTKFGKWKEQRETMQPE